MTKAPVRFEAKDFYAFGIKDSALNTVADYVNARLADYFKDAKVVYSSHGFHDWCDMKSEDDQLVAYLVGIEKIEKGVTKDEIVLALKNAKIIVAAGTKLKAGDIEMHPDLQELADRIEREGIKP